MPRRRPNPAAWVAVAIVLLLVVLVVRALGGGDGWTPEAARLAGAQAKLGTEVTALRTQIKNVDRLELFRKLRRWEREARAMLVTAESLEPPQEARRANGYLMAAMGLRADALRRLVPSVQNALSDKQLQVAVSQLVNVMRDLVLADRSYELCRTAWPDEQTRPPASRWVGDDADAEIEAVTDFVRELRNQEPLKVDFNLTLRSVSVEPRPVGKEREADLVPFTKSLDVVVVIENTGNQAVSSTTISAVLTSETDPEPRTAEGQVGTLRPKDRKSVTLKGLEPVAGEMNLLSIRVDPVGEERKTLDNKKEYTFVMRKP